MNLHIANENDIETLVQLRLDYFQAENTSLVEEDLPALRVSLREFFQSTIPSGKAVACWAEDDEKIVSAAFLVFEQHAPTPLFFNQRFATLYNVLTYPEYRRKGYAKNVLTHLFETARQGEKLCVSLYATEMGQPLYASLGFEPMHYTLMRRVF